MKVNSLYIYFIK